MGGVADTIFYNAYREAGTTRRGPFDRHAPEKAAVYRPGSYTCRKRVVRNTVYGVVVIVLIALIGYIIH